MAKRHYIPVTTAAGERAGERDAALIRRAIRTALACEGVAVPCEVDVLLTDDAGIRELNREMRRIDAATDVLSFPAADYVPGQPPADEADADPMTGLTPLGDMAISLEHVAAQAAEYGHSRRRELAYLVVHSVLHLLGYDHLDEGEQKRQMRAREETILARLELPR
jgi:probable rRNA maturation factor